MSDDIRFEEEEFETQFNGGTLLRIMSTVRPHWKWVAGFLLCIAFVSVLESYFTFLNMRMIDEAIIPQDAEALREIVVEYATLLVMFVSAIFGFIYLAGVLVYRVQYDLRKQMFDHLQTLSFSYFDRTPVGWIMSRVTSDSGRISELVTWGMVDSTWAIMNIITAMGFMFFINWRLALIVMVLIPVLLFVAVRLLVGD